MVIVALLGILPGTVANLGNAFIHSFRTSLGSLSTDNLAGLPTYFWNSLQAPMMAFIPLLGVALGVGLAANFAQVGFHLSGEALTPNLNKINPLSGLKRLFGAQAGVEGLKAIFKFTIFGAIAYAVVRDNFDALVTLTTKSPMAALSVVGGIMQSVSLKIGFAWLALAALDYFFQRKQVDKQLKMTKEEVKQEMKEMEQSPELRQEIANRRRRMSRRMMQAVKTADAIITNPTHFAIAIKYDSGKMPAPQVVAKGADLLAARIREVAKENRIPIVPNPPLARTLYKKCEVGDFVPRDLFLAVAEVLAYVYQTLKGVRNPSQ